MAKKEILKPFIRAWEGGFANIPGDRGGATKWGITIGTFRSVYGKNKTVEDLKRMTEEQWNHIYKTVFWDKWKADHIESQSVANLLVDWYWNSGKYGIKLPQKVLGVTMDGIVGPKTIAAINNYSKGSGALFEALWTEREAYFRRIATQPAQRQFLKGWLNRLNGIRFGRLTYGGKTVNVKE